MMDQNSHLILALLCNCPFLLVWNCASGQCVLSLDTANCQAVELLKCGATYLAAITSVSVLIWDMGLIRASALAPKSGKRVEMVAVGSHGESCYSSDGSELIWKWGVSSGKVEGPLPSPRYCRVYICLWRWQLPCEYCNWRHICLGNQ